MGTVPAIVVLLATLALGAASGVFYLQRLRRPLLVRAHLMAAILGVALVAMLVVTATPLSAEGPAGLWPLGLLGLALAGGYGAFRLRWGSRAAPGLVLAAHVMVGIAGFLVFLAWARRLAA